MKRIHLIISTLCFLLFTHDLFAVWTSPIDLPNIGSPRLRIVGQNTENYLTNLSASNSSCSTQSAFNTKTNKMANVFLALEADVVAVCEVETNDTVLSYICAAMNTISGTSVYKFIKDGHVETASSGQYQGIKSGFIYRSDKVAPVGESASPYNDGSYYQWRMRTQTFREISTGELFILSMNHFKANSSGASDRITNANYLISHLDGLTVDPDVLIMGDLNAEVSETAIQNLINAGYAEQLLRFDASAWTYIYKNAHNLIDHAMANSTMANQITGAEVYHINNTSSVPSSYQYSDHDPYVVGLNLGNGTTPTEVTATFMDGSSTYTTVTGTPGSDLSVVDPTPCEGYTFLGWSTNEYAATNTSSPALTTINYMPSSNVTYYAVYSRTVEGGSSLSNNYAKISSTADLTDGSNYLIVANNGSTYYALTDVVKSSYYVDVMAVTPSNDVISNPDASIIWQLGKSGNNVSFYSNDISKYLYSYTSSRYTNLGFTSSPSTFTPSVSNGQWSFISNSTNYYIIYNNSYTEFTVANSTNSYPIYLYKQQTQSGTTYYTTDTDCDCTVTVLSEDENKGTATITEEP